MRFLRVQICGHVARSSRILLDSVAWDPLGPFLQQRCGQMVPTPKGLNTEIPGSFQCKMNLINADSKSITSYNLRQLAKKSSIRCIKEGASYRVRGAAPVGKHRSGSAWPNKSWTNCCGAVWKLKRRRRSWGGPLRPQNSWKHDMCNSWTIFNEHEQKKLFWTLNFYSCPIEWRAKELQI